MFWGVPALCALLLTVGASLAQDGGTAPALPDPLTAEAVNALVSRLSDAEVRALLLDELAKRSTAEAAGPAPAEAPAKMMALSGLATKVQERVGSAPRSLRAAWEVLRAYFGGLGGSRILGLAAVLAIAVGGGLIADRGVRRLAARRQTVTPPAAIPEFPASVPHLARRLLRESLGTLAFLAVAAVIVLFGLPEREAAVALTIVAWLIVVPRLAAILLRFLLSPKRPELRLLMTDDGTARLLDRNLYAMALVGGVGVAISWIVEIVDPGASDLRLGFWLGTAISLWLALVVVRARAGLRSMIPGGQPDHTPFERLLVAAYPAYALAAIAFTWVAGVVADTGGRADMPGGTSRFLSLALLLIAPMCDAPIRRSVSMVLPPMHGAGPTAERAHATTRAIYERMMRVLVFGAMLLFLAWLWGLTLFSVASMGVGEAFAETLVEALLIALAGYFTWELVRLVVSRKLSNELVEPVGVSEEHDEGPRAGPSSRLGTILPVVSWFLQAIVVVLFGLTTLGHLGFDVTALLASAGVAGLAIGFGAQKLVADVVSGLFFLADDAFRLNEYIDTGGQQGTVEKIALRSLTLRQSDGPVQCIPYSNISAITNFGRDWGIMKMTFTVPFDTDVEKVRKIFKRIGQDLLANPEFKDAFILPFKSQGVREFTDSGIVVRGKFTFRPDQSKQFLIRREIFKRVQADFAAAGIGFARSEVRVSLDAPGATLSEKDLQGIGAAAEQAVAPLPHPDRP